MTALIVEDEPMALRKLERMIAENFPDISVKGATDSVEGTVAWLKGHRPDVIFMDVELADGNCFEIFKQTEVSSHVVMTTAYDSYAIKAFEVNSIDFLLKPYDLASLTRAVERCRRQNVSTDVTALLAALRSGQAQAEPRHKERYLVRINDRIVPVKNDEIAFFESEAKSTYLTTFSGHRYIINPSLDEVAAELDPEQFFRVSRGCIIAKEAVASVTKLHGSRLSITSNPASASGIEVSRTRVQDFLDWLGK